MFPILLQGHINPMLQLADVLHERGLAITVLHTHFNVLNPALRPEFQFVVVPDGVPSDVAASGSFIDIIDTMNAAMEAGIRRPSAASSSWCSGTRGSPRSLA
ncbi:hypothetical protein BAE44_0017586 [Dichanthelium oligosanthes]|uniref:Uncharacterized protein n=1 Tax=Dichanthelium oligosanthes TaxID=888268 RepID=A0A1E5V8R6_9POAL|nr:hypothetical protein BAE44_0017586 [Dichanthelium oligosanthes]